MIFIAEERRRDIGWSTLQVLVYLHHDDHPRRLHEVKRYPVNLSYVVTVPSRDLQYLDFAILTSTLADASAQHEQNEWTAEDPERIVEAEALPHRYIISVRLGMKGG